MVTVELALYTQVNVNSEVPASFNLKTRRISIDSALDMDNEARRIHDASLDDVLSGGFF